MPSPCQRNGSIMEFKIIVKSSLHLIIVNYFLSGTLRRHLKWITSSSLTGQASVAISFNPICFYFTLLYPPGKKYNNWHFLLSTHTPSPALLPPLLSAPHPLSSLATPRLCLRRRADSTAPLFSWVSRQAGRALRVHHLLVQRLSLFFIFPTHLFCFSFLDRLSYVFQTRLIPPPPPVKAAADQVWEWEQEM